MSRRPVGVWLVVLYLVVTQLSAILAVSVAFLVTSPETAWARDYYRELSWPQIAYVAVSVVVWLGAAVALFRLKKQAFPLLVAGSVLGAANLVWQGVAPWLGDAPADAPPVQVVGIAAGALILAAMLAYVWRLRHNEVLR